MPYKNLIYEIRKSIGLDELIPITCDTKINEKLGIRECDIYKINNLFHYSKVYVNKENGNIVPILELNSDFMRNAISKRNEHINELIKENNFEDIIYLCDGQFALMCYEILDPIIPFEKKYDCFMSAYTRSDYNFENASVNLDINKILDMKRLDFDQKLELKKICNSDLITIYRAQGSKSTDLEKAISWTIDLDIARKFAKVHNLEGDGVIYKAKVNIDDITDYITDRGEREIIVSNYYLQDVKLFRE